MAPVAPVAPVGPVAAVVPVAAGPTGATGATGATGPTGPANPYDVYCSTAAHFAADLTRPPVVRITPPPVSRARQLAKVTMTLSKPSTVVFAVSAGGRVISQTMLDLGHGRHLLVWRPPHAGAWTVSLSATDLTGRHAAANAAVRILPPLRTHRGRH